MPVLITGGAGYIGAHVAGAVRADGDDAVLVDDLSTGFVERVGDAPLERIDLTDGGAVDALRRVVRRHRIDAVVHLAAKKRVDESLAHPLRYYRQNVGGLANLLAAVTAEDVRALLFSSSAAVYGEVDRPLVDEHAPTKPINPYGRTKLIGEWLVADAAAVGALAACSLRYFNVAGAADRRLADRGFDNLIPRTVARMLAGEAPTVYGTDFPTPDGTCVRDFVHVVDLAEAHVAALRRLRDGAAAPVYNIGTGTGCSVREVIDAVARRIPAPTARELPRRAGDPASVVADPARAAAELGWTARLGLEDVVESAVDALRSGAPSGR